MDHRGRLKKLQGTLDDEPLDAMLVTHLPNIRYLCGFTGTAGALVVGEVGCWFFTDGRYKEQARIEVKGCKVVVAGKPPLMAAAEWLTERVGKPRSSMARSLGIESEHLTVAGRAQLAKSLRAGQGLNHKAHEGSQRFQLHDTRGLVERARMVKDADEIECLRKAAVLGASLFERALEVIRPGARETEVAAEMEYAARRAGAEEMSFATIIASGKRSALPHGRASQARIPARGFVVCDFGVILAGYCSDRTRTVHVGRPRAEDRRMYEAVREAQRAAIASVRVGIAVSEVDKAARKVLQMNGLAKRFTHSTGHGVGLEIHEAPRIASGQRETLRAGMVVTVEPGVYVAGSGGVRIEDVVVVTERGCEVLAPASTELITI